jgi:perosamine synthetase
MSNQVISHSRPSITEADVKAVSSVLESGQIAQGPVVSEFEQEFSAYIGKKSAAAVSSGTAALHLALKAMGVKEEDEVIIPSFVCTAVLNAVIQAGARPVVVDIDPHTYNISVDSAKDAISKRTRAMIIPHMFGCPAEIDQLSELDIPLIEDCAQSVGASYKGKKAGSLGLLSIFSFYATKVLTTGEGGMVVSDSEEMIARVKELREYDQKKDYEPRFNCKMTDIQAALGLSQLSFLEELLDRRAKIASRYFEEFEGCHISLPIRKEGREHIYYRFVVKTSEDASPYLERLQQRKVMCQRPVFVPLHVCLGLPGFSRTTGAWQQTVSIPLFPSLTEKEIEKVIAVVKEIF